MTFCTCFLYLHNFEKNLSIDFLTKELLQAANNRGHREVKRVLV